MSYTRTDVNNYLASADHNEEQYKLILSCPLTYIDEAAKVAGGLPETMRLVARGIRFGEPSTGVSIVHKYCIFSTSYRKFATGIIRKNRHIHHLEGKIFLDSVRILDLEIYHSRSEFLSKYPKKYRTISRILDRINK